MNAVYPQGQASNALRFSWYRKALMKRLASPWRSPSTGLNGERIFIVSVGSNYSVLGTVAFQRDWEVSHTLTFLSRQASHAF